MTFAWSAVGTVVAGGVRLGYHEAGDPAGTPVVLLHGTGSRAGTWERFASWLAGSGYRAVVPDLRGHASSGRSRDYSLAALRDDVLALVDALRLRGVVLVGHSVGGHAALAAAQQAPDLISRLVLEDLAAPPRPAGRTGPEPVDATGAPLRPWRLLALGAGILSAPRDYHLRAMASIFRQVSRPDRGWWERLGEVRQPTLVLSGGATSCIPPRRLAGVAAALPDARFATIPVGHRVHSLAPEEFRAAAAAFLDETAMVRTR